MFGVSISFHLQFTTAGMMTKFYIIRFLLPLEWVRGFLLFAVKFVQAAGEWGGNAVEC